MASGLASVPLQPLPGPEHLLVNGIRFDGRGLEEFRNPVMQTGVVTRARGSAYVELGVTKVMAAVYGPRPSERKYGFSDMGCLAVDVNFTSIAAPSRNRAVLRAAEKDLSGAIAAALAPSLDLAALPKALVEVQVLVLEEGGGSTGAAITAASLAVADAGLPAWDLVPACSVAQVNDSLLLDPSTVEQQRQEGGLMLAYMQARNEVTQVQCVGAWSNSASKEALELALGGAVQLRDLMRSTLLEAAASKQAAAAAGGAAG